jgi:hypothetical protein
MAIGDDLDFGSLFSASDPGQTASQAMGGLGYSTDWGAGLPASTGWSSPTNSDWMSNLGGWGMNGPANLGAHNPTTFAPDASLTVNSAPADTMTGGGASTALPGHSQLGQFGGAEESEPLARPTPMFTPTGRPPVGGPQPPVTAHESQAEPWWKSVSGADVNRSADSGYYSAIHSPTADPAASIASAPVEPPTFGDKLGAWGNKTLDSLKAAPGNAADEFAKSPISSSMKLGSMAMPLIAAAVRAANAPKQPGRYTTNPPALPARPVLPLPGTTGNTAADIPAASPMSPLLAAGPQGGFRIGQNRGMAEGGRVGHHPEGEFARGGIVPAPAPGPANATTAQYAGQGSEQARAIMDFLARMHARSQGGR